MIHPRSKAAERRSLPYKSEVQSLKLGALCSFSSASNFLLRTCWLPAFSASTQMPAHQHARPVQLPFRRPGRDAEHDCDLPVLVTLDVVQHENLARPRG